MLKNPVRSLGKKNTAEENNPGIRKNRKSIIKKAVSKRALQIKIDRRTEAAAVLKEFQKDTTLYMLGNGKFSAIDLVFGILDITGKGNVDLSTWTVGPKDIDDLLELKASGKIEAVRWLMDISMHRRESPRYAKILQEFGPESVRLCQNHAKVFLVYNPDWSVSVLSSANFNMNPRTEWYEVQESAEFLQFTKSFFDGYFNG